VLKILDSRDRCRLAGSDIPLAPIMPEGPCTGWLEGPSTACKAPAGSGSRALEGAACPAVPAAKRQGR